MIVGANKASEKGNYVVTKVILENYYELARFLIPR